RRQHRDERHPVRHPERERLTGIAISDTKKPAGDGGLFSLQRFGRTSSSRPPGRRPVGGSWTPAASAAAGSDRPARRNGAGSTPSCARPPERGAPHELFTCRGATPETGTTY